MQGDRNAGKTNRGARAATPANDSRPRLDLEPNRAAGPAHAARPGGRKGFERLARKGWADAVRRFAPIRGRGPCDNSLVPF